MRRIMALILFAIFSLPFSSHAQFYEVSDRVVPFHFYVSSMPAYYRSVTSLDILADSLKSPVEMTRIRAAYRMAELGNADAIPLLITAYENEPLREDLFDMDNGLRDYALVAIGIIGGAEAENFLCPLAEEMFFEKGLAWAKGDAMFITGGLLDGLSMTESVCAESLLYRIIAGYEKKERPIATLEVAYAALNRLLLIRQESHVQKAALLNEYRTLSSSVKQIEDTASTKDYYKDFHYTTQLLKSKALQTNVIEIGMADLSILQEYKNLLSAGDPFIDDLDYIVSIVNEIRDRRN